MASTVLMVSFFFPPAAMSSGHLRTLGFARYLPALGWDPIILSARALAYPQTSAIADDAIPKGCKVHRAFALDASRHLAIGGRYPGFLAQPDRWASWWPAAVLSGLRLIRRHKVKAIWSTYPIMTAHHIAYTLSHLAGLPWIADFRDPVATSVEPGNPYSVVSQQHWERRVIRDAAHTVFTTPGARDDYAAGYPQAQAAGRLSVIENGYDEAAFANLPSPASVRGRPLLLVHSGLLYVDGRSPVPFFEALAQLKSTGALSANDVHVVLRASGSESLYQAEIDRLGISDLVTLAPRVSNHDALVEQARADGLLLFQGSRFNRQIPAKLYEYVRIGRPTFALTDAAGDTAATLRAIGCSTQVPLNDAHAIAAALTKFIAALRNDAIPSPSATLVAAYSRQAEAATLAALLHKVTTPAS